MGASILFKHLKHKWQRQILKAIMVRQFNFNQLLLKLDISV